MTTLPARQLSNSIYELYKPPGIPNLQVIFFHGFQNGNYEDAHLTAWESADGTCLWPQTWLVEDYPKAHILSVSYSFLLRWELTDVYQFSSNLMLDLVDANIGQMPHCRVILVGHSFGGIIIKSVLMMAHSDYGNTLPVQNFLSNVKGLFFYSTPDVSIDDKAKERLSKGSLLVLLNTISTEMLTIGKEFRSLVQNYNWRTEGLIESLPTQLGHSLSSMVVPEEFARGGLDSFHMVTADHIDICKPRSKFARNFRAVSLFIENQISRGLFTESEKVLQPSLAEEPPDNYEYLPESTIGLDLTTMEVNAKLQTSTTLGIGGMGGVGKTTLAKMLFNDLRKNFEYTCFVHDVKDIRCSVSDAILECMNERGKKIMTDKYNGLGYLKGKKLLLVLDDVQSEKDLQIISILKSAFCVDSSSVFIVTSRNLEVLRTALDEVYVVPLLDQESARRLFMHYTFPEGNVPPSFDRYLDDILQRCEGLPLTIEVVGKYLYQKRDKAIWEQVLRALDEAGAVMSLDSRLWARLQLSYDGLNEMEQDMFLDAATVCYNIDLDVAKAAWSITTDGYQDIIWQRLVDWSIVFESRAFPDDSNNFSFMPIKIGMHQQLQSLGRKIASSCGRHGRRIWENRRAMGMILESSQDMLKDIVALNLTMEKEIDEEGSPGEGMAHATEECIRKMRRLRHLSLDGIQIQGAALPSTLVFLTLSKADFIDLPLQPSNHKRLAVLRLNSCHQLRTLPDSFDQLSSLQVLHICRCYGLKSLPNDFWRLPKLKHLEIETCNILRKLPMRLGDLAGLEHLILRDCKALAPLPDSLARLERLKTLVIDSCNLIKGLPKHLFMLKALERLSLSYCKALSSLPESLGDLRSLKALVVQSCPALHTLPESVGKLRCLENLSLSDCESLSSLPESLGLLRSLKTLVVQSCPALHTLPKSFGMLGCLENLSLSDCKSLSTLTELDGDLWSLKTLVVQSCPALHTLPESVGMLKCLENLSLSDCENLSSLPESLGLLRSLKTLVVQSCPALHTLPESLGRLGYLENLSLSDCKSLSTLSGLDGDFWSLKALVVQSCPALHTLPESVGMLRILENLSLGDCKNLSTLPASLGQLQSLKALVVQSCPALHTLPESVGMLKCLENLSLSDCESLLFLPKSLGQLQSLKALVVQSCPALHTLPESVGMLKFLENLSLSDCKGLLFLPESLGKLRSLKALVVQNCPALHTLPESVGMLMSRNSEP